MADDMERYMGTFVDETMELMDTATESLSAFEESGDVEHLQGVMRALHTIKGTAQILGLENIGRVAHRGEDFVVELIKKKGEVTEDEVSFIYSVFSLLEKGIAMVQESGMDLPDEEIKGFSDLMGDAEKGEEDGSTGGGVTRYTPGEVISFLSQQEINQLKNEWESGKPIYHIYVIFSPDTKLKRARLFMLYNQASSSIINIYSQPSQDEMDDENSDINAYGTPEKPVFFLSTTDMSEDDIRGALNVQDVEDIIVEKMDYSSVIKKMEEEENGKAAGAGGAGTTTIRTSTVRVRAEYLDELLNLVGEAMISQIRMSQLDRILNVASLPPSDAALVENLFSKYDIDYRSVSNVMKTNNQIVRDLQEIILKMRLVPLENIFMRFPRMVRDIARNENKKVKVRIIGSDVEVDRTLLDVIGDAMLHILRNSIDHGIEDPETREKAGKPREGNITIKAYTSGNLISIDISDDGRGIDTEKIKKKAVEKGLLSPEKVKSMSPSELYELLFMSGFSTRDTVSDISGRGVGLDVVRRKLNDVGGKVRIKSEKGKGTTIGLSLPPVVAIVNAMLFRAGGMDFALPVEYIVETANLSQLQKATVNGVESLRIRDDVVPLVDLAEILGIGEGSPEYIIVVQMSGKKYALAVDRIHDRKEVVVKQFDTTGLNAYTGLPRYISIGATILEDGRLALILDAETVLERYVQYESGKIKGL